jgi:hypothetical protein
LLGFNVLSVQGARPRAARRIVAMQPAQDGDRSPLMNASLGARARRGQESGGTWTMPAQPVRCERRGGCGAEVPLVG